MGRVAAVGCIAAAAIACVAWALHSPRPHVVGSNGIRPSVFVGAIPPHSRVCETAGTATEAIDRVEVTVGTNHRPQPLRLELPGAPAGPVLRGYADGAISLALAARRPAITGAACVRNLGDQPVQIAGEPASPGQGATVRGRASGFHVSFRLIDDTPPRWWSDASPMLARVGLGRAGAGGRALGTLVVALVAASLLVALGGVWRWIR